MWDWNSGTRTLLGDAFSRTPEVCLRTNWAATGAREPLENMKATRQQGFWRNPLSRWRFECLASISLALSN
jgi:hypothetical protein